MTSIRASRADHPAPIGLAKLLKMAYEGQDLMPLRDEMIRRAQADSTDAAALMDLCAIEQFLGDRDGALRRQEKALEIDRLYRSSWPASSKALRVLAFVAAGDVSANTPIEFLLKDSDVALHSLYILPGRAPPQEVPEHDVAIVTVGESDAGRIVMAEIERLLPSWPVPVLNRPDRILRLSREETWQVLAGTPGLVMPSTARVSRQDLEALSCGMLPLEQVLAGGAYPLIARPTGSHAGRGLAKLNAPEALEAYLVERPEGEFYLSRFVDYRSPDGLFRKYRIVWVDGHPFPVHMAIADDWKVWYLNADMTNSAAKRAEEARFMEEFDEGFAARHREALASAAARFGLEYAGIDCAETVDGRLLVFEADISMIVHDLDSVDLFPYKVPAMRRLFAAFHAMLQRKSKPSAQAGE